MRKKNLFFLIFGLLYLFGIIVIAQEDTNDRQNRFIERYNAIVVISNLVLDSDSDMKTISLDEYTENGNSFCPNGNVTYILGEESGNIDRMFMRMSFNADMFLSAGEIIAGFFAFDSSFGEGTKFGELATSVSEIKDFVVELMDRKCCIRNNMLYSYLYDTDTEIAGFLIWDLDDFSETESKETEKNEATVNNSVSQIDEEYGVAMYENTFTLQSIAGVNMREKPSQDAEILATIASDSIVTVIGSTERWYKIEYNDMIGYSNQNLFKEADDSSEKNNLEVSAFDFQIQADETEKADSASYWRAPTFGEKNALEKAYSYLKISAFSYLELIEQLEYEGFLHSEAVYAADHCGADWYEQAAQKANSYLSITSMSKSQLIKQLKYNGFTEEQAEYGAKTAGY